MAAESVFSGLRMLLLSLPWILYIIIPPLSSAAPSAAHDGHTHPALQPGDFASIPEGIVERQPSTRSPIASAAQGEEIPFDPHPVVAGREGRPSRRVRDEFYRPKRTVVGGDVHPSPQTADLEDLVENLKTQLKESQAAQVHTRSIINVLQEKVEAQENDLSIMKNEISHMRREQSAQREMISSLKSSTSDTSWAIASVKHGQDQTAADLHSLKHLQDHQNETLLVMEEVIMSNALELQNYHRHVGAIRHELFQLRGQITEDRDKMKKVERTVLVLQSGQKVQSGVAITDENKIEEEGTELTNHLLPYEAQAGSSSRGTAPVTGRKLTGLDKDGEEAVTAPPSNPSKLEEYDIALEVTKGLLSNLSEHVTSVENQVMLLSQKQLLDSQLLQLQESFMNFTRQVYQLQHWRVTSADRAKDVEDEVYQTQHENDMASVIFHLENHSERIRALESLALKHQQANQLAQHKINSTLIQMNTTFDKVLKEVLEQPRHQRPDDGQQLVIEGRVKVVEEELRQTFDRVKDFELALVNASLAQCRSFNDQLTEEAKSGSYVKQIADVQMKISEQTTSIARLDRGLAGIFQELDKNAGTSSSLAEQVTDLKKLSPEVVIMQRELLNFVLQLPTDCYDVPAATGNSINDGVYLIRPEVSRQSARTFCLVEDEVVWTVIQRRTDGRESFARSWDDYRQGFGDAGAEFWLGNENIHRLTDAARVYRLRIDMWDVLGRYWLADYASFRIHAEDALYRLDLGDFSGNATDALRYSNLMPFSALDRDNDVSTTHCAQFYQSGWWYKHCHYSNLNGRYTAGMVWFHQDLDEWIQMKQTTMRISMVIGNVPETHAPG